MEEAMRTILFFPQTFGLFPFELSRNRLYLSNKFVLLKVINITILGLSVAFAVSRMFNTTPFEKVILLTQTAPILVTVFFTHLLSLTKIDVLRQIVLAIGGCEEILTKLDFPVRSPKFLNAGTYSSMFLCLVFGCIHFSKRPTTFVVMAYVITMMLLGSICLVVGYINILEMIFRRLNAALIGKRHSKQKDIDQIINAHNNLVDVKESVDKAFASIILPALVTSFVIVTENVYLTLTEFRNDIFDYTRLFYVVLYSIPTWNVVSSCTTLTVEVSDFHSLLYRLCKRDKHVLSPIAGLTLQKYSAKLMEFNAYGFVTIDRSLLGRMLSSSVTLLTILIQFGG